MPEWPTLSAVTQRYVHFLCTRPGAGYLVGLSVLVAVLMRDAGWVAAWSGPLLVVGGHLVGLVVLTIAGAIGDALAGWINDRFLHLSATNRLHRSLYFLLTCITLPIGVVASTLGDFPT